MTDPSSFSDRFKNEDYQAGERRKELSLDLSIVNPQYQLMQKHQRYYVANLHPVHPVHPVYFQSLTYLWHQRRGKEAQSNS